MRRRHCLSTALLALPGVPRGIGVLRVAAGQEAGDSRFQYAIRLLRLALNKAGVEPTLQLSTQHTQHRQVLELRDGRLDIGQLPASGLAGTEQLLPVRVPLRRGLLGLRLLLATTERAPELAESPSLFELQRRFRLGHGADWGDLELMRRCGFRVVTSSGYAGLFRMLEADRFDFLSRAVSEVWDELASPQLAGSGRLVVVPKIALFYPLDDFFWVSPRRPELAEAIELGLQRARDDGSFDALFRSQYGSALQRAGLAQRQVFKLPCAEPPAQASLSLYDVLQSLSSASRP